MTRSKLEMYMDVLIAIRDGKKKLTHIMATANVSTKWLKSALKLLIAQKLIIVEKPNIRDKRLRKYYIITTRGKDVLSRYEYFKKLFLFEEVKTKE